MRSLHFLISKNKNEDMNWLLTIICSLVVGIAFAQPSPKNQYWISFKDKQNSPFDINQPEAFLSPRAIEKRNRLGIVIDEKDIPVNPAYLAALWGKGAVVRHASRWLNGATIIADSTVVANVTNLEFIQGVQFVGKHLTKKPIQFLFNSQDSLDEIELLDQYYGHAQHQIEMLHGDELHSLGYQGENIWVALLDGGFINADKMPFFDSLHQSNRMLPGRDIVDDDQFVWESSSHGSKVLSLMASNIPGFFVGTAPKATYICIKTEDTRAEYLGEECNWIVGAEYADSLGVDVINSSLGYTTFGDDRMNYRYKDLNGQTSKASLAAEIAFQKGMLIVNSAGNSGNHSWKYIGVPADSKGVLAVGATNIFGNRAEFSSYGPTSDGRLKPNVVAMGEDVNVASVYSTKVQTADGTSFSSPLIAGMAASLWSAFPDKTNIEIFEAIERSGHQYRKADQELGNGVPNFYKAYLLLKRGNDE